MKKLLLLSVIFFGYSCSPTHFISPKTINLPLYSKSNRTVIFDNKGIIIENKKHYKSYHMKTGLNRYAYIAYGVVAVVALIVGPFPALL